MTVTFNKKWGSAIKLVDFSDIDDSPTYKETDNWIEFSFNDNDLLDIKLDINSTISLFGVKDNGTGFTNDLGKDLYAVYDELLYQTK